MKQTLFLLLFVTALFSHPHTFMDVYPTFKSEGEKTTLNFKWIMDDMTSAILIMDLDTNGNGKIDANENKYIQKEYFSMFKEYDYYTYVKVKGKNVSYGEPKNFQASIEQGKICYSFDIVLNAVLKDVVIEFGDKAYYTAMVLKKEFVNVEGYEIEVTRVEDDYYGFRLAFK